MAKRLEKTAVQLRTEREVEFANSFPKLAADPLRFARILKRIAKVSADKRLEVRILKRYLGIVGRPKSVAQIAKDLDVSVKNVMDALRDIRRRLRYSETRDDW